MPGRTSPPRQKETGLTATPSARSKETYAYPRCGGLLHSKVELKASPR